MRGLKVFELGFVSSAPPHNETETNTNSSNIHFSTVYINNATLFFPDFYLTLAWTS